MILQMGVEPYPLIFGFGAGLILGSFVNTVIDRLPEGLSLVRPRSHCPGCKRPLAWWELVPVLSFIFLKGRCRSCGRPVGFRIPLVELAVGLLGALIGAGLGLTWAGAVLLSAVSGLVALGIIDLERGLLPDAITWPLLAGGLAWSWAGGPGLKWSALGALLCGGSVWLVGAGLPPDQRASGGWAGETPNWLRPWGPGWAWRRDFWPWSSAPEEAPCTAWP